MVRTPVYVTNSDHSAWSLTTVDGTTWAYAYRYRRISRPQPISGTCWSEKHFVLRDRLTVITSIA